MSRSCKICSLIKRMENEPYKNLVALCDAYAQHANLSDWRLFALVAMGSGPVAYLCRSKCSFEQPPVQKRPDFSSPTLSAGAESWVTVLRSELQALTAVSHSSRVSSREFNVSLSSSTVSQDSAPARPWRFAPLEIFGVQAGFIPKQARKCRHRLLDDNRSLPRA